MGGRSSRKWEVRVMGSGRLGSGRLGSGSSGK